MNIVMAYYENPGMLEHHIKHWNSFKTKSKPNVFITDDGSPRNPAEDVIRKHKINFPLRLFRIIPNIPWNQNGARNLSMQNVSGWTILTDMDHEVPEKCYIKLLQIRKTLDKNKFYIPKRFNIEFDDWYKDHPNSYIIHSELYWKANGMNEAFAGYYGSDKTFRRQLLSLKNVYEEKFSRDIYLNLYGRNVIADASTTDFGRKDSKYYVGNNKHMQKLKKDASFPREICKFDWKEIKL